MSKKWPPPRKDPSNYHNGEDTIPPHDLLWTLHDDAQFEMARNAPPGPKIEGLCRHCNGPLIKTSSGRLICTECRRRHERKDSKT